MYVSTLRIGKKTYTQDELYDTGAQCLQLLIACRVKGKLLEAQSYHRWRSIALKHTFTF